MQAEKNEQHHFDPYVKIEVLESERRLENQIHQLEIKMLKGFADLENRITTQITSYIDKKFNYLFGLATLGFAALGLLQYYLGK